MNAMVEQHFKISHGHDSRLKPDQTSMLVSPILSYSSSVPHTLDHAPSSSDNFITSLNGMTTPPISTLPQIVFSSHMSNYNTHTLAVPVNAILPQRASPSYSSTQPSPLEYHAPPGPLSQFPRQDTLSLNSTSIPDHAQDSLSVESHTPHSIHSKNSFSSFTDLRFPEQSSNANSLSETNTSSSTPFVSRSPFEPAQTPWMDTTSNRLVGFEQPMQAPPHIQPPQRHTHLQLQHPSTLPQSNYMEQNYRSTDLPNTEMSDQQVKNLLMITNSTSSSTGKRKPRESHENLLVKSEENYFICKHCGKTFAKGYNLKSHLKTHSDERPFQCSFCPRSFARNHDKKRHELLHQGVKKFQCGGVLKDKVTRWGCGKRFSRADGLGRHFRTDIGWLCIRPLMLEAKEKERLEDEDARDAIDETSFGTSFINDLLKKAQ